MYLHKCTKYFVSDPNKVVHTELTLERQEFEQFEVDSETKITFCLKELKVSICVHNLIFIYMYQLY